MAKGGIILTGGLVSTEGCCGMGNKRRGLTADGCRVNWWELAGEYMGKIVT